MIYNFFLISRYMIADLYERCNELQLRINNMRFNKTECFLLNYYMFKMGNNVAKNLFFLST